MGDDEVRTKWDAITMNLAFMLSKTRNLSGAQIGQAAEWLDQQVRESAGHPHVQDICKFVLGYLTQQKQKEISNI